MTRCLFGAFTMLSLSSTAYAQQSRSPFNLSATRDFAVTGMRTAAGVRYWISNAGPMDTQLGMEQVLPAVLTKGANTYGHFSEVALWATAGVTDFNTNRARYAALNNVRNAGTGGHTASVNNHLSGTATDWLPSDGSLGIHFSGARAPALGAGGAACLSHSKDAIPPGMTLTAGSDCPETWGANGWQGRGNVPFQTYLAALNTLGNAFTFDFWRHPEQSGFIGNNFQTYGFISDFNVSNNADYGNVVPGGTGAPRTDGYPLALEWQFDAFNFKDSRYAGVVFWQATVTNRSTERYGVPFDYDSLYAGFVVRPTSAYARGGSWTEQGTFLFNVLRHNTNCDNGRALPEQLILTNFTGSCTGTSAAGIVDPGFTRGASALVVLKSPIGDLRNKLFSDATSPFNRPGHPLAGDTITFNVARNCGLECSSVRIVGGRARSAWGVLSSHEADALAGDQATALPGNDYWFLFHPANAAAYPDGGPRVDIANPRAGGGFNYCVPGNAGGPTWTYRSARPLGAPLGPDTLFLDDCNPTTHSIVPIWNDTFPDRSLKLLRGSQYIGAGPFRLAAGETQSFVVAMVMAPDSTSTEATVRETINLYRQFYAQPQPPPLPRITAVDVDGGSVLNTFVRITLDPTTISWVDDFLLAQANLFRTAAPNTPEGRIQRLNPWLDDSLAARATNNIGRVLVYKSCNPQAATLQYTISRNINGICSTDEMRDSLGVARGPAAYQALAISPTGAVPTLFTDGNVLGGQSYLYAFVAETRGAQWTVVDSTAAGMVTRTLLFESPIAEVPRTRAAANVVTVYVPASHTSAGGSLPDARFPTEIGGVTMDTVITPGRPTVINSWNAQSVDVMDSLPNGAQARVIMGEPVIIDIFRQPGGLTVDSTRVRVVRTRTNNFTITGTTTLTSTSTATTTTTARSTPVRGVVDTLVFSGPPDLAWATAAAGGVQVFATPASTSAASVTIPNGSAVIDPQTNRVLWVSNAYIGLAFTPASFPGRSNYIPFRIGIDTTAITNATNKGWLSRGVFDQNGIRIAPNSVTNPQALDWLIAPSRPTNAGNGGEYAIRMAAPEFNTLDRFNLNEGATALSDRLTQLLNTRAVAYTTLADAGTAAIVARFLNRPNITADSLIAVSVPFTITNRSFNRPVQMALLRRDTTFYRGAGRTTYRIGQGADTMRLNVPADQWLPGDLLILLEDVPVGAATERVVTFYPAVIGCGTGPCNPVGGVGGDANYGPTPAGWEIRPRYVIPARSGRDFTVSISPTITGTTVQRISQTQMDSIQVVPNPYVVFSAYEQQREGSRITFTHLPPEGTIRIFTVAGQFVQQITWLPEQLSGGDLQFDLRTREGTDMASGLYLFVVSAKDPETGRALKKTGRFIIIR